jgi:hypothetical protein
MQPNQNNYDFILNPQQNSSRGPSFLQDPKQRMIVSVLFVLVVITLVIVVFSAITSIGRQDNSDLRSLAAQQSSLVALSAYGVETSSSLSTRTESITLQTLLTSDLSATQTYLAQNGITLNSDQLAGLDADVETALTNAQVENRFEQTYNQLLNDQLTNYRAALQAAINNTSGPNREQLLNTAATNIIVFDNN